MPGSSEIPHPETPEPEAQKVQGEGKEEQPERPDDKAGEKEGVQERDKRGEELEKAREKQEAVDEERVEEVRQDLAEHVEKEELNKPEKEHNNTVDSRASTMKGEIIGEGSNATAYELKEDPNLVLLEEGKKYGHSFQEEHLASVLEIKNLLANVPTEVNTPQLLDAWIEGDLVYTLMERAKGQVLHQMRPSFNEWRKGLEVLAAAPQSQYDKLISDSEKLHEAGLNIDPRPTNFLYDRETGFHFIDLDKFEAGNSKKSFDVPFINTGTLFNSGYSDRFPQIRGFVLEILSKLEKAGDQGNPERIASIIDRARFKY